LYVFVQNLDRLGSGRGSRRRMRPSSWRRAPCHPRIARLPAVRRVLRPGGIGTSETRDGLYGAVGHPIRGCRWPWGPDGSARDPFLSTLRPIGPAVAGPVGAAAQTGNGGIGVRRRDRRGRPLRSRVGPPCFGKTRAASPSPSYVPWCSPGMARTAQPAAWRASWSICPHCRSNHHGTKRVRRRDR
jgi:hypothetical protein